MTCFNLAIWSPDEKIIRKEKELSKFYKGFKSRSEIPAIYAKSKIVINMHGMHVYKDMTGGSGNLSLFEIPASGGFQIADLCNPEWFKIGEEIVLYDDIIDLKNKISHYLENEEDRERIAKAGRRRALEDHTYEERFKKIFKYL